VDAVHVRAPLRISLGGGGTDLASYVARRPGFVVSAAIDRYVRVSVGPGSGARYTLSHLEHEETDDVGSIGHPILREAIGTHWRGDALALTSSGDVDPGTGLGSSGAYAVGVVKALRLGAGLDEPRPGPLAEEACRIEIDVIGRTVGKQDQYAAAHGGLRAYEFAGDGTVTARELQVAGPVREALRERFLLFDTGERRSASDVLAVQEERTRAGDGEVTRNLDRARELAVDTASALEAGDLDACAELMAAQWELKRARSPAIVTERTALLHAAALAAGARAVTLMGAGAGGHLLAYTEEPERVREALGVEGAPEVRFDLDTEGCVRVGGA
jgi:D-glycero-alpha-D-manno-heptose-7-phosphate kinase